MISIYELPPKKRLHFILGKTLRPRYSTSSLCSSSPAVVLPEQYLAAETKKKETQSYCCFFRQNNFLSFLQLPLPVSVVPVTPAHRSDDISNVTVRINSSRVVSPSSPQENLSCSSDVTVHKGETSIVILFTSMVSCDGAKSLCG